MNLQLSHEMLVKRIARNAGVSLECRQVAKRLRELLPTRLQTLKERYRDLTAARAQRQSLVDPDFVAHVEELVTMRHNALEARVQYETHVMLVQARQTLRAFQRNR